MRLHRKEERRWERKNRRTRRRARMVDEEGNPDCSSILRLFRPCWGLVMGVQQNCFSEWNSEEKQNVTKQKNKQGLEIGIRCHSELLLSTRQEGAAAPLSCTPPDPGAIFCSYQSCAASLTPPQPLHFLGQGIGAVGLHQVQHQLCMHSPNPRASRGSRTVQR